MDITDAVEYLIKAAEKNPDIQEAEAYSSRNVVSIARVETLRYGGRRIGPNPQQVKTLESTGASVRVVHNKAVGMSVTSYLTEKALDRAIEAALANARRMEPDPNFFSLARPVSRVPAGLPFDEEIASGEVEDSLMVEVEKATSFVDEPDMDLAGKVMAVSERFSLRNSNGIAIDENIDTFAVAQLTAERLDGAEVLSSGVGWDSYRFLKDLNSDLATADAVEDAKVAPVHKKLPEGDYSVILGQYAVADVIDNMLASAFNLGNIYMGFSWVPSDRGKLASGREGIIPRLGQQIACEALTFKDMPLLEGGMASKAYDDEGLPTQDNTIIENGAWVGAIANSYYSYLYGREPTGNGFRTGTIPGRCSGSPPSGVGTNMSIEPGDMALEEMVESSEGPTLFLPRTWYTYPTRYGAPTFSSSNRSTSYIVERGELVPVAPNAFKLIGDVSVMLREIYGIGSERKVATTWAAEQASIVPIIATKGVRVEKSDF